MLALATAGAEASAKPEGVYGSVEEAAFEAFVSWEGSLAGVLVPDGDSEEGDVFRPPPPEKMYKPYPRQKYDWFSEMFRIGISTGLLIPLLAREAGYDFGWWSRLTLHRELDLLGLKLFRTMAELSAELGQSTSMPSDQSWHIVSTLYFFRLRAVADFLPDQPGDLYIFGGVGLGFERARGHQIGPSGYAKIHELNVSPLLEGGAGVSLAISRAFMLDCRASVTWPVTSGNIILYLNIELGAVFLFF